MIEILYSGVDIQINESEKRIIINPLGERFYYVACDEQHTIFRNAELSYDKERRAYIIEGDQTLINEHYDSGSDYEKLLCLHPAELIHESSGLFGRQYYKVRGTCKREIHTIYHCRHSEYEIAYRAQIKSQSLVRG